MNSYTLDKNTLFNIASLGPYKEQTMRSKEVVIDCFGRPFCELSMVPKSIVEYWIDTVSNRQSMGLNEIEKSMRKASIFLRKKNNIKEQISILTGTPIYVVNECFEMIYSSLCNPANVEKLSSLYRFSDHHKVYGAKFCKKGKTFFVQAAGNSPGIHYIWLEALALGYKVLVRPSRRDPLTPFYLINLLYESGICRNQLIMVPCNYENTTCLVNGSDFSLIYGGNDVVSKYSNYKNVLIQGPGRSKLIVMDDGDNNLAIKLAVEGMIFHGGTACTSTSCVFVEKNAKFFANEIAKEILKIDLLLPFDKNAKISTFNYETAKEIIDEFNSTVSDELIILRPNIYPLKVDEYITYSISPGIISLSNPNDNLVSYEWPFACICVSTLDIDNLEKMVSNSLVISIVSSSKYFLNKILEVPTVSNVYQNKPTSWHDEVVPHDSFLSEFLMKTKGFSYDQ